MASIRELHQQLVKKERSATEIAQAALDRNMALTLPDFAVGFSLMTGELFGWLME